jgi:hypothetical protein
MKQTVRERIESLLNDYRQKKKDYAELVHQYSLNSEWEDAMKADIKMRQVDWMIKDLESALA